MQVTTRTKATPANKLGKRAHKGRHNTRLQRQIVTGDTDTFEPMRARRTR